MQKNDDGHGLEDEEKQIGNSSREKILSVPNNTPKKIWLRESQMYFNRK
jgi:hypothetical protein